MRGVQDEMEAPGIFWLRADAGAQRADAGCVEIRDLDLIDIIDSID
jgi:hypothetical protein